jgi:hypothetical protein
MFWEAESEIDTFTTTSLEFGIQIAILIIEVDSDYSQIP